MAKLRKKPDYLSEQQFNFFEYYLESGNITQSAIKAGYSEKTASAQGSRLLSSVKGKQYIDERMAAMDNEKIASADEVLEYLTRVMRGEEKDQFDLDVSIAERTKAATELAKRLVDKQSQEVLVRIVDDI